MFDLRIVTAEEALLLLQERWPNKAVSLIGDDLRFELPHFGPHHLVLRFHDLEASAVTGFQAPAEQDVRDVLEHTADLKPGDRLLVHCHAGRSRSPAMAIAILIQHGLSPAAALERVKFVRPQLIPNRLIIRQIDHVLSLDGDLIALIDQDYQAMAPDAELPDRGGLG